MIFLIIQFNFLDIVVTVFQAHHSEPIIITLPSYGYDNVEMDVKHQLIISGSKSGPSCSKLTTSLVNDSLKFKSSDMQIC